jgi:DNA-binding beta-propeller fold protein YncE
MRARERRWSSPASVGSVEVLESRLLLSASSIVSHLAATPNVIASTVPANGDENPYGVAFVPAGFPKGGKTQAGDVLVSNFNNSNNDQGTGTTIVSISPSGKQSLFFEGKGLGLTTALGVLPFGYVIVGSVPTTNGTFATLQQGSLLVLNKNGGIVANLKDPVKLDGPWDLTIYSQGIVSYVFVTNVLNGTVTRLTLVESPLGNGVFVASSITIGSGYTADVPNQAALILGPTGVAFNPATGLLYVASTADNAIYAIPDALTRLTSAGRGELIFKDNAVLRGPLGLALLPDGNLIAANGDAVNSNANQPSELVEFTPTGQFVGETSIDPSEGGAFGLAVEVEGNDIVFAAVDDVTNSLDIWEFKE